MISAEKIPRCLKAFYVLVAYEVLVAPWVARYLGLYEPFKTLPEELGFVKIFIVLLYLSYYVWLLFVSIMLWGRRGWARWLLLIGMVVSELSNLPMLFLGSPLQRTAFVFSFFLSIAECVLVFSPSVSEYCRGRRPW